MIWEFIGVSSSAWILVSLRKNLQLETSSLWVADIIFFSRNSTFHENTLIFRYRNVMRTRFLYEYCLELRTVRRFQQKFKIECSHFQIFLLLHSVIRPNSAKDYWTRSLPFSLSQLLSLSLRGRFLAQKLLDDIYISWKKTDSDSLLQIANDTGVSQHLWDVQAREKSSLNLWGEPKE